MFSIKKYKNFNDHTGNSVTTLLVDEIPMAGLCKYPEANYSIFFIEKPTLSYIDKGSKYMSINRQEFFLKTGDLILIPENSIVFTFIPHQPNGFESINMVLPDEKRDLLSLKALGEAICIKELDPAIQNIFIGLKQHIENKLPDQAEKKRAYKNCLAGLMGHLKLNQAPKRSVKKINIHDLEAIKKVLLANIFLPTSVSSLAQQCHMSTSTFKRKFELIFGIPPKTWKREICLQTARFNLRTGQNTVSDVCSQAGFDNMSHFSYAFKKYFKALPSVILASKLN